MTVITQDTICAAILIAIIVGAIRWIYKTLRFVAVVGIIAAIIYSIDVGFSTLIDQIINLLS